MEPLTHRPKKHLEWNESYYYVFYDLKSKIGGMTRIGFKPNKNEGMTFFFLFLPDGSAAGYQAFAKIGDHTKFQKFEVGNVVHEPQPDGKWKYRFKGQMYVVKNPEDMPKIRENRKLISYIAPVTMEMEFLPINEVYEYSKHMTPTSREIGRKSGDAHWEQIGVTNGKIRFGDKNFEIRDCMSQRDHTHGVRDWTGIGNWLYYVVWFSKNLAINPAAIITEDGRIATGGFMFKNGKNIPIKSINVLEQKFRNEIYPVSSKLEIIDAYGETHILEGKAGPIIPIPFVDSEGRKAVLTQSFGEFKLDNIEGGYGTFETLRIKQ